MGEWQGLQGDGMVRGIFWLQARAAEESKCRVLFLAARGLGVLVFILAEEEGGRVRPSFLGFTA